MSLNYTPLPVYLVRDPRTNINSDRDVAILKTGSNILQKVYTSNSISSTSWEFTCPPSAGNTIVQKKVWLYAPMRFTFTATVPPGLSVFNAGYIAPRAFPFSSQVQNMVTTINGTAITQNMGDILHALMHFNTGQNLKHRDYSFSPCYADQSQQYSQLFQQIKDPLGPYGACPDEAVTPRGGFPFNIISNPTNNTIAPAVLTGVIDMAVQEPVFMSPFEWGHSNNAGFINVNQMDFSINFYNNSGFRAWSHNNLDGVTYSSITVDFLGANFTRSKPEIQFTYIQPDVLQMESSLIPYVYPYFEIIRFTTDFGSVNAGVSQDYTANNTQLSSIPRRTYAYLRPSNNMLLSTCDLTDSYFSIERVPFFQFKNTNSILSGATKQQLYEICVNNHIDLDWNSWSGEPLQSIASFANATMNGVGGILCIEYGKDVWLDADESSGIAGQYTWQMTLTATNRNTIAITPTFYVVHVFEGAFNITSLGSADKSINIVSKMDVLDAQKNPHIDYHDIEEVNGGNFLSGLKRFGQKIGSFIKDNKLISKGLKAIGSIPTPYTQAIGQIGAPLAENLGFGEGEGEGEGVIVGGRRMSRSALRRRLH